MVKDNFEEFKRMGLGILLAWDELIKEGKKSPDYKPGPKKENPEYKLIPKKDGGYVSFYGDNRYTCVIDLDNLVCTFKLLDTSGVWFNDISFMFTNSEDFTKQFHQMMQDKNKVNGLLGVLRGVIEDEWSGKWGVLLESVLDGSSLEDLDLSDEDLFVLLSIQKQYSENVSRTVGGFLSIGNVFYKHKGSRL